VADILFKCPSCEKHLAIDEAGSGTVIGCVDCKNPVHVPELAQEDRLSLERCGQPVHSDCRVVHVCCESCGNFLFVSQELLRTTIQCPVCRGHIFVRRREQEVSAVPNQTPKAELVSRQTPKETRPFCTNCNAYVAVHYQSETTGYVGGTYNAPNTSFHPMMVRPVSRQVTVCANCGMRVYTPKELNSMSPGAAALLGIGMAIVLILLMAHC
jgi:DNA-directed RNA polymerase subunit M/transcription elongation factor TFIIS